MAVIIRTFPLTLSLLVAISIIGLITDTIGRGHFQTLLDTFGFDLDALKHGRLYVLPLGPLIQDNPGFPWKMILTVLPFVAPLEYVARPLRTVIIYFATDIVSTVTSTLFLWGLAALGSRRAEEYIQTPDIGSSSAAFGCAGAFAAMLPGRWRLLAIGGLVAYLLPSLFVVRHVFAIEHLIATSIGFGLGLLWRQHTTSLKRTQSLIDYIETRAGFAGRRT